MNIPLHRAFLGRAAAILLAFAALRLAGGPDAMDFLSGTADSGRVGRTVLGICYLFAHLGAWVLAPILLVAAALDRLLARGPSR